MSRQREHYATVISVPVSHKGDPPRGWQVAAWHGDLIVSERISAPRGLQPGDPPSTWVEQARAAAKLKYPDRVIVVPALGEPIPEAVT